ncbi:hypothetical protein LCGC14_0853830 [marine sediment metagenome]|uniref:Uncharacterized protein n=1 Tax=marine sediment metagenome TaxID=412755 RepID=A0A0F9PE93_9ZZZZ
MIESVAIIFEWISAMSIGDFQTRVKLSTIVPNSLKMTLSVHKKIFGTRFVCLGTEKRK